ncbi:MAG: efflux RND transporter periplasmic adaptor subunit [bacterium]|nr:efflux RND transporter periplasmic adaptor subunit [bacterium]
MTLKQNHQGAALRGAPVVLLLSLMLWLGGCSGEASTEDAAGSNSEVTLAEKNGDGAETAEASSTDAAENNEEKPKKKRERSTSVNAAKAYRGDLVIPVIADGTIRARHSAEIRTEIAGRITKIVAREGQSVRKGALLAKLDDRELVMAREEARAKYLQAISLLAIEQDSLEIPTRPEHLQKQIDELAALERRGVISRQERLMREVALDVQAIKDGYYRTDVMSARSGIAQALADVERAGLRLEQSEIRAPFSGVVTGLQLSPGEQVNALQTFCTIVNNTDIEAEVGVLESDIAKLETGRNALLFVPALNKNFKVTVDVISPRFDRDSRTCEVLLRVENTDGKLRPGMFVRAKIAGETFPDRMLVPREAILTRDGRPLLFKVEDDRAKWLYVKLGPQNDSVVEIERVLQGGPLNVDDLIVVTDHLTLSHDTKIKIKKVVPIDDEWSHTE